MPAEVFGANYDFLPKPEILTFEEVTTLATMFAEYGVDKLRLTGGEPLLRRGIEDLVAMLDAIPGERDLAMTTNGTLLKRYSQKLKDAGLDRVTVSLDAMDDGVFGQMNGVGASSKKVVEGIDAALEAGLGVKINSVMQKGVNEGELMALVDFARDRGVPLRFIEFMDTGNTNQWKLDEVIPSETLREMISQKYELEPMASSRPGETARRFRFADQRDLHLGFISSVTQPFCQGCNRARLSADGQIFTCLFAPKGHDIKTLLRSGASAEEVRAMVASIWASRDDRYSELRSSMKPGVQKPEMSYIGG